jgi:hypothetical protein
MRCYPQVMNGPADLVTVYRSMDAAAKEDCDEIADLLRANGLSPAVLDDHALGVTEGTYEVRVPAEEATRAEKIIADRPLPENEEVDPSEELDLEPIYHSEGSATAEFEALEVKGLLEANGIPAIIVGDSVLPNLGFEVRVPRDQLEDAKAILEEAQKSGPADAEKAELESETQ